MLKKIDDYTFEEQKKLSAFAWEFIEHNGEKYKVEVISSKEPLVKGKNVIYSSLRIFRDADYGDKDSLPVYQEVFKETITSAQCDEAMASVRKFPNTYITK